MGWLKFIYYIDIYAWLFRALAQNEFYADRFQIYPDGPNSSSLGVKYLEMFSVETDRSYQWYGILFGCMSCIVAILASFPAFLLNRSGNYFSYFHFNLDRNFGSIRRVAAPDQLEYENKNCISTEKTVLEISIAERFAIKKPQIKCIIPFDPMIVTFQNIEYTVELEEHMGGGFKKLLHGINGFALPGRMIALMGASGAGKTTLLDVLACRKNSGEVSGTITLNGHPKEDDSFSRITCYVEQQDMHMAYTTVREALEFSANLRLPEDISFAMRDSFIDEIIHLLELNELSDRRVGDIGSSEGLSPGERKRLTIAVELVSNAPVLFLDEPTSGLDARSAAVVMRVIKKIANTGRTVICTIHQPSADVFFMFDDLLLLQKGGYMVYFGPIGENARDMLNYLEKVPEAKPCPNDMNPSSWMLDLLSGLDSTLSDISNADSVCLNDNEKIKTTDTSTTVNIGIEMASIVIKSQKTLLHSPLDGRILSQSLFESKIWSFYSEELIRYSTPEKGSLPVKFKSKRSRTFLDQFWILLWRQILMYWRNIPLNFGRLVTFFIIGIMFGVVYYKTNANDVAGVSTLVAGIFMTSYVYAMINMQSPTPELLKNRAVFYREQSSFLYDSYAYSLAYLAVEIPWVAFLILVTMPVAYFMIGLAADSSTFFAMYVIVLILSLVFGAIGYFFSSMMPNYEVAQAMQGRISPILFLFGGLFAPVPSMPVGTQWVTYIDPITYAFRAIIPLHFYCEGASCPTVEVPTITKTLIIDRYKYVKQTYDVDYFTSWTNNGYLFIFVVLIQIIAFVAARYKRLVVR